MQKKSKNYFFMAIVLAFLAIFAYYYPFTANPELPVRILLPNSAGRVVFDHTKHMDYGFECISCHHELEPDAEVVVSEVAACSSCHGVDFSNVQNNLDEHINKWSNPAACETCHHIELDGERYVSCSNCHEEPVNELIPNKMAAYHDQCMTCHEEVGTGPYTEEQCNQCHIL